MRYRVTSYTWPYFRWTYWELCAWQNSVYLYSKTHRQQHTSSHRFFATLFLNPYPWPIYFSKPILPAGGFIGPLTRYLFFRDNFSVFWKSQSIVNAFEHNVLKFKVVLVLYYFEYNTLQSWVIFHEKNVKWAL